MRHHITGRAVTARGRLGELTVFVAKTDGHAVNLWISNSSKRATEGAFAALPPGAQISYGIRVVHGHHGYAVFDLRKSISCFTTDALGWTVWIRKQRMVCFKRLQFGKKRIKFSIAHEWRGINVVRAVRPMKERAQFSHASDGIRSRSGHAHIVNQ